jgi:hypothetical protein
MKPLLLALVLVGCGSKPSQTSTCADAIGKGVDQLVGKRQADGGAVPPALAERMTKLKQVLVNRCTEDKWSTEIMDCYAKAATREDFKACRSKLAPEAQAKLQMEEMAIMTTGAPVAGSGATGSGVAP